MNRIIITIILLANILYSNAQDAKEIKVSSEISEATVFIHGAQVLRKKVVTLPVGKSNIVFTNLSPYAEAKSVQTKLTGNAMVLGVNYRMSSEEAVKKLSDEVKNDLQKKYLATNEEITTTRINVEVVNEEIGFLNENKKIGGANTGISLVTLRETTAFYTERMAILKMRSVELNKKLSDLNIKAILLRQDMNQESPNKPVPMGEVVIEVDSKQATSVNIELTYYVKNAGWYPSYDIRAVNINKSIELLYKANIQQNTQEDWNNVRLSISSANPNLGSIAPQLKTYYLDYNLTPPRYDVNMGANEAKGIVVDNTGIPLIGATVAIKGSTIGTTTDAEGKFSLALPNNTRELEFKYLGFISKTMPVSASYMNVRLEEDNAALNEVVVVGYATTKKTYLTGSVSTVSPAPARTDIALPTQQIENQTSVEFEIKIPYTIKSSNKNTVVEVDRYALPAEYEYYTIPKVNKDVFLLANISDWEQYNLLEGEANIFFEDTYVGKTIMETRNTSDTLSISLGRDKNITTSRENIKDHSSKKFLSNKKEDARAWKINVRNNKTETINLTILDQVPVSRRSEIEVTVEELSGGSLNEATGEVKWNIKLKPANKKELELKYRIKHPNNQALHIE